MTFTLTLTDAEATCILDALATYNHILDREFRNDNVVRSDDAADAMDTYQAVGNQLVDQGWGLS